MATIDTIVDESMHKSRSQHDLMRDVDFDYQFTFSSNISDKRRDYSKDEADEIQLIANELIANALKAIYGVSEPRKASNSEALKKICGRIDFKVYEQGDNYILSCQDNGSGIPDEIKDRIFEPGFSTRKTSGVGLGIMRQRVEKFGGKIYFESEVNKGTTFYVELPKQKILNPKV